MRRLVLALCLLTTPALARPDYGDFLAAQFAIAEGNTATAATDMLRAAAADPTQPDLRRDAFVLAMLAGRPEAAALADSQTDNPAARLLLANREVLAGNWQGAELAYAELHGEPLTVLQPLLVAWCQQAEGRTDDALATLGPLMAAGHAQALYVLHAALIADAAHRDGQAGRLYDQVASGVGRNLRLAVIEASFAARAGNPDRASKILDQTAENTPELGLAMPRLMASLQVPPVANARDGIAEAYLAIAAALQSQPQAHDFATILLRLALELRPDLSAARLLIADADLDQHHPAAALQEMRGVPDADPLTPVVQLRMAGLEAELGQDAAARGRLARLAQAYPGRIEPYVELGQVMQAEKHAADAVAAYDHAISLLPHPGAWDWAVFFQRATALDAAHRWPDAEADLLHALALSPNQAGVLNYLGYSYAVRNEKLPQARTMIERALAQSPQDGAFADSLGWVLLRQGDAKGAMLWLTKASTLLPGDPTVTGHLGDAYWASGKHGEALALWRRALGLSPDPDDRTRIEDRVRKARDSALDPAKR